MTRHHPTKKTILEQFPPSAQCSCPICLTYCARPGWWTVSQAAGAIKAGFAQRMMLEIAPELTFGVLSPAFKGNEGYFALDIHKGSGCTFFSNGLCELHSSSLMPLECRFCHHDRPGLGNQCHLAIEQDWNTPAGQELVIQWSRLTGLWERLKQFKRFSKTVRRAAFQV